MAADETTTSSTSTAAADTKLAVRSSVKCFGGLLKQYGHSSKELQCDMVFSVYYPPQATDENIVDVKLPVLWWLSGLTCTDQNFATKAGGFRSAAEHGLILIMPDTSPRGCGVPGEDDCWDFGTGAGFYVDATTSDFKTNYRMYSYIKDELRDIVVKQLPGVHETRHSIFGHSMGGHGAITLALKNPDKYMSVSAFAPICNPCECPWGQKAFKGYFGDDKDLWKDYDATHLVGSYSGPPTEILIDQGKADIWLEQGQLQPREFVRAAAQNGVQVVLRMHDGYDHGYYFIQTFIDDHIRHHAEYLKME